MGLWALMVSSMLVDLADSAVGSVAPVGLAMVAGSVVVTPPLPSRKHHYHTENQQNTSHRP